MKIKSLLFVSINGICFFAYLFFKYRNDNLPWFFYLILAVLSLLFGWTTNKMFTKSMNAHAASNMDEDVDLGEEIIYREPMSRFRNKVIADGGIGYLLKHKIVFIPYSYRGKKGEPLEILFENIKDVSDFKFLGIINTGLKITTKSGHEEQFVIDKTKELCAKLQMCGHG